jgi:type II secretory pathway component PulF
MKLAYKGFNKSGQPASDVVEARDVKEATESLRRQGIFVTEVVEADAGDPGGGSGAVKSVGFRGAGKRLKAVAGFVRQLHVLISTGTPLVDALVGLERQATDPKWRPVVASLRDRVEQGASLSAAMADHPEYFDAMCRGLIAAGESGGHLDAMLERLAVLCRKQVHVRSSVVGAMLYPAVLMVVSTGVMITLLVFVLPRFTALFVTLGTPLPPTTKMLMDLSGLLRTYWWALPLIIGGAGFGTVTLMKTPQGKRTIDASMIWSPKIGPITRSFATARILRLMGILLQGRVPLVDALMLTRESTTNWYYTRLLQRATDGVTRGEPLAVAFADDALVPPSVCEAVKSGDRTGQLGPLLATIADFLDEENEVTLRSLTSVLEPLILVVLGVFVGFVAVSMFMPLFDLTAATRGN